MKNMIAKYCKELRLGNVLVDNYQKIRTTDNEEFLVNLLEIAVKERESNRKNRLLKQANFDMIKTFENYMIENIRFPKTTNINELKDGSFIDENENLIFYGAVGTGKTHLATAIGVNACNKGKKVKFYKTSALVNDLIEAQKEEVLNVFLRKLEKLDLLICDEWGYIPLDTNGGQLLFQVIASCYEKRSVIITTNLEFSNWNSIFYDEKLTSVIIDRLIHHSHLLVFSGESYRVKHAMLNV